VRGSPSYPLRDRPRPRLGVAFWAALASLWLAAEARPSERTVDREVWEVNGIRLERDQIDRLADDMAERTVEAVKTRIPGIALQNGQEGEMRRIYREVALGVFDRVVGVVESADLDDDAKEARVRELVLDGQRQSHTRLEEVLEASQMELYTVWEQQQVDAYKSRRYSRRRRRRGR